MEKREHIKQIISGKRYDTEKATFIANIEKIGDLYETQGGRFFVVGDGKKIKPTDRLGAYGLIKRHGGDEVAEVLERHFSEMISDA